MTIVLIFAFFAIAYWLIVRRFFPHALDRRRFRGRTYGSGYSTPPHSRPDDTWPHQHTAHTQTVHASDSSPAGADGSAYTGGRTDFEGFGGGGDFGGGGAGGDFGDSSYSSYTDSSSYSDSGSSSSDSGSSSSSSSD